MNATCPRCHLALREETDRDVVVATCPAGHGRWLSAPELEKLTGGADLGDWLLAAAHSSPPPVCLWCHHPQSRHGATCERCGGSIGAVCPACEVFMPALEVEGVTIDFCARCGGLWLDAGESVPDLPEAPPPLPAASAAPPAVAMPPVAGYGAPASQLSPPVPGPLPAPGGWPAGPGTAAGHRPAPIRLTLPRAGYAAPVAPAPAYYDPYWSPAPAAYAYGPGYWYAGGWYDPYYPAAMGVAAGVGAVAAAGALHSVLDWGYHPW